MIVNNIFVTETTPRFERSFMITRSGRPSVRVAVTAEGISLGTLQVEMLFRPAEAKALIEVLQELTK